MPQAGFERIVLSNGKEANIPVDKDGYVPVESLIKRFNFVVEQGHVRNRPKDYDEHASVVLPIKMTPREAAAWWVSPNSYDVEYIDAPGKAHYNVSGIKDQDLQGCAQENRHCLPSAYGKRSADPDKRSLSQERAEKTSC